MTKEEQIKEMKGIICQSRYLDNNCEKCGVKGKCVMQQDAKRLYKAGYRKQEALR